MIWVSWVDNVAQSAFGGAEENILVVGIFCSIDLSARSLIYIVDISTI